MKKIILWGGIFILIIAALGAAIYWESRPQVVILKNGTKLTLLGVTYGKHHSLRGIKSVSSRMRGGPPLNTTNDTIVVWIKAEYKRSQFPNYQLFVLDPDRTACVSSWQSTGYQPGNGVSVSGYELNAYPRRDRKMILRVAGWGNQGGMQIAKGEFVVNNPGPRSFPDWQAEPIPDTQSDGDLSVTLTKCSWGSSQFMRFGNAKLPANDPMQKAVSVAFSAQQGGKDVTNWQAVAIQTSDATGNQTGLNSWSTSVDANGDPTMTYQWGLWPNEKAWKLRVEMSRTSGFSNSELWAVSNVPLKKGNWNDLWNQNPMGGNRHADNPVAETTLQGIHLKIYPALELQDQNFGGMGNQKQGGFRVSADPPLPDGYRLSLAEITDENGRKLPPAWGPNGGNNSYIFQLPDLRNAKSLNLTIALHQSRFVEFTVKPTSQ